MLNDLLTVGGSVLTMLLMMAVGFFLAKRGLLTKPTLSQLSTLLLYIVCPAIMIDTLLGQVLNADTLKALLIAFAVLAGTYVLMMLLIQLCFRRSREEHRGTLRFAAIYGNTGFMGIPLIQAVLGEPGMIVTVVSLAVFNISIWTHGAVLIGGRQRASVKKALLNPGTIGFLLALVLFLLHVRLPGPVAKAVSFMGSLNTPLAMIVIGGQMAAVDLKSLFQDGRLYAVSVLKLLAVPMISLLVLLPFGLDPIVLVAVTILAGCPTAGATSLMCQTMGKDTDLSARLVTMSTLLSIITLPVVAAVARMLS